MNQEQIMSGAVAKICNAVSHGVTVTTSRDENGVLFYVISMLEGETVVDRRLPVESTSASLLEAHTRGFINIFVLKMVRPLHANEPVPKTLLRTIRASVKSAAQTTTCEWLISEGYASDEALARKLVSVAMEACE